MLRVDEDQSRVMHAHIVLAEAGYRARALDLRRRTDQRSFTFTFISDEHYLSSNKADLVDIRDELERLGST